MLKGVKIIETIDDFLKEHPELKVQRDTKGRIIRFIFPDDAKETSYIICFDKIYVSYTHHGRDISFSTYTIDDFLRKHSELKVERDVAGKIIKFIFPNNVEKAAYFIFRDNLYVSYIYRGENIRFYNN